jgi:hypothetical protein
VAFLRQTDPAEYDRIVRERHERWDNRYYREIDRIDAADWERQESYDTDPIDTDTGTGTGT